MSSIKNLTYQLWRRLANGEPSDDDGHTYEELAMYIRQGLAVALKANFYESLNNSEYKYNNVPITVTTKQTIQIDEEGLQYVEIPQQSITVAGRMLSITSPNPVSTLAVRYIPMRYEEVAVAKNQPPIPCVVLYYREGNKAIFYNYVTEDTVVKVNQKYTLPTDDNADIVLPDAESMILENALKLLGHQISVADMQNNGSPI